MRSVAWLEPPITYRGSVAAVSDGRTVWFASHVKALEADHPVRRFVATKCLVARVMQEGPDAEPYDDALAEFYARCALLPDDEFDARADLQDAELAEHFNVPLEQVSAKRRDRAYLRPAAAARSRDASRPNPRHPRRVLGALRRILRLPPVELRRSGARRPPDPRA